MLIVLNCIILILLIDTCVLMQLIVAMKSALCGKTLEGEILCCLLIDGMKAVQLVDESNGRYQTIKRCF